MTCIVSEQFSSFSSARSAEMSCTCLLFIAGLTFELAMKGPGPSSAASELQR